MTTKTVDSEANGASLSLLDNMPESAIYEYDQNNKLKKVTTADTIAAYSYLPDGRRASKTVNGVKTSHIWDGNNIVADSQNGILTKYIRSNKLEQAVTGDNIQNYTVDSRGDVIDFGDADYFYDAFGNVQIETNPNPFGYCGEYFDQETGFIYLRNRYYNPTIGRFTQEDPIRDGSNWYAYCANNPTSFVDPLGLLISVKDDGYNDFLGIIREIYGDPELDFIYSKKGSYYTISDVDCSNYSNGSSVGKALVEYVVKKTTLYTLSIYYDTDISKKGTSGYIGNKSINLNAFGVSYDDYPLSERASVLVHELTHAYTDSKGYDKKLLRYLKGNDNDDKNTLLSGYQEATAITVENKFREEMGYNSRNTPEFMIDGKYGFWPHLLNTYPVTEKSRADKLVGVFSGQRLGISLMESVYIWYDILHQK